MDKNILQFVTFCIGYVARHLQLSPCEVYHKLKDSGILYDYIVPSYDVLHTFGSRYLTDDIVEYMREKGVIEACAKDVQHSAVTDDSKLNMRDLKSANVIMEISRMYGQTFEQAADIFYNSDTAGLMIEGVADLHCRSDKYLAAEIWSEYQEKAVATHETQAIPY